jgi:Zn-dependent oligopeptidase
LPDILKQFDKQGMRNRQFAKRYRYEKILTTGCSTSANQLVEHFLSRPFNFDAFIECLNGAS